MNYLNFLRALHAALAPGTYLEIGIRNGDSLALAQCTAVGIDPDFELRTALGAGTALFEESSDEYFERADPLEPLGGRPIDLAFIDGMHLAEFALRDFANVERHARWTSVAVFDDILPREPVQASRDRRTQTWTGDVYKMLGILERHRPDLICLRVGTDPTGLLLVLGLDPASRVLEDRYDRIIEAAVVPDPQRVPADVLERRGVLDPAAVASAPLWGILREAREGDLGRRGGLRELRRAVRRDLGQVSRGRLR
ncbi:MAG: class I SAM-dependent methyltransferase, partial [Solirubrobacteraceae bacterium]